MKKKASLRKKVPNKRVVDEEYSFTSLFKSAMMSDQEESKPASAAAAATASSSTRRLSSGNNKSFLAQHDGIEKGVGSIFSSLAQGAAVIIGAPIIGATEGSKNGGGAWGAVKGFGAGLGVGVVSGAVIAAGGAAVGIAQLGRGLYRAPGAVSRLG